MTMKREQAQSATAEFSAQYKDPRWQKKRLQIMEQDRFMCRRCHSKGEELHVHHLKYKSGARPWEYPDSNLVTLCEPCHNEFHIMKKRISDLTDPLYEEWLTNKNEENFDAYFLWQMLISINSIRKCERVRFYKLIQSVVAFAYFNSYEELTREDLYPINCDDRKAVKHE